MLWIIFALGAALAWGLYGPVLHKGQVQLGNPMRALLCVGAAYFLIGVLVPVLSLSTGEGVTTGFTTKGATAATIGDRVPPHLRGGQLCVHAANLGWHAVGVDSAPAISDPKVMSWIDGAAVDSVTDVDVAEFAAFLGCEGDEGRARVVLGPPFARGDGGAGVQTGLGLVAVGGDHAVAQREGERHERGAARRREAPHAHRARAAVDGGARVHRGGARKAGGATLADRPSRSVGSR